MNEMFGQTEKALSKAADLVTQARTEVKGKADRMGDEVAQMLTGWGGQGATSFSHLMVAWREKQEIILKALDDLSAALIETEKDNVATDEQQSSNHANLRGRLG